ncbi:unnamed protein product, partial [marine sediment metagenome]
PRNLEKILYFAPDRRREQLFEVIESEGTGLEKGDIIYSFWFFNFAMRPFFYLLW